MFCVKDYVMQQQVPSEMPTCVKNEKPLLVTTQVKLVDPADEYVICSRLVDSLILVIMIALWNRTDHYIFILFLSSFFLFFLA